jgi:hypothetical protein
VPLQYLCIGVNNDCILLHEYTSLLQESASGLAGFYF